MEPLSITVYDLYAITYGDEPELKEKLNNNIFLEGWIKSNRDNKAVGFIDFNDGTNFKGVQLVYSRQNLGNYDHISKLRTGTSIGVVGKFILTPEAKQPFEVHIEQLEVIGECADDFPLQKKYHSVEFLRDIAHLRPRTTTFSAVFRVRNALSIAIHQFFQEQNFMYVHTPIITGSDAEGAGAIFSVVTGEKKNSDFFGRDASLTVSGQLHVEAFAMAFRDVYTFGPTFRAENSNTPRHASEFWMIEPEIAFADLNDDMALIESCVKYCIESVLENCPLEMDFFNNVLDTSHTLLARLESLLGSEFKKMTYTEAIEVLSKAVKDGVKFDNPNIVWGMDLQSEHERYITEKIIDGPVFIINYPKDLKAFYMYLNDDGKTVAACDLLVPYVGELVGGSQREDRYELLKERMEALHLLPDLEWYLDLRKFGGCPHAGFGIGFDRLLMYITGISNIRDVQPYPRSANALKY
ncbi:MAG: asparagine--tRNA ligase [Bacilli bacterium]|jgi:asparaginyl-tRNA synthetase